jgi:phosphonate transport system permease protein
MSTASATERGRPVWRPKPSIRNPLLRYGLILGSIGYLYLAFATIDVNWNRVVQGMERAQILFAGFLRPDSTSRWQFIQNGILESITMAVVATGLGIVLAIPSPSARRAISRPCPSTSSAAR